MTGLLGYFYGGGRKGLADAHAGFVVVLQQNLHQFCLELNADLIQLGRKVADHRLTYFGHFLHFCQELFLAFEKS